MSAPQVAPRSRSWPPTLAVLEAAHEDAKRTLSDWPPTLAEALACDICRATLRMRIFAASNGIDLTPPQRPTGPIYARPYSPPRAAHPAAPYAPPFAQTRIPRAAGVDLKRLASGDKDD